MRIHFWGVRGSLPTPLTNFQLRNKITAIVQRITPEDLVSEDARENFIQHLPEWLTTTVGGNTACVEVDTDDGNVFVLDAGSGLREMSYRGFEESEKTIHLFFSHFHWDHIMGFPFFGPVYNKNFTFHIYSPWPDTMNILSAQMEPPYFPVKFSTCTPNMNFHLLEPEKPIKVGDSKIICKKMFHPGASYSYKIIENGKQFVYATDVELTAASSEEKAAYKKFFMDSDMLVLDSQYTVDELFDKPNWGHSTCCHGVELAQECNIKRLYLFHHEPTYDDKKISSLVKIARWYADSSGKPKFEIQAASEGMDVLL